MTARKLAVGTFPVPFNVVFKHTSAARAATENIIVKVTDADGIAGFGEGCPRSYVTGESEASALRFVTEYGPEIVANSEDLAALRHQIEKHRAIIDKNPAAFCALELAVLDLQSKQAGRVIEHFAGILPMARSFSYSAVLSDSKAAVFGAQVVRYRAHGLRDFKLKLSGDLDRDGAKFRWFRGRFGALIAASVRVDANNLWSDPADAISHLRALDYPFLGVEEPLQADDLTNFLTIAEALDTRIILDESLLRAGQLAELPGAPSRWILNCRVSKSGGLLRSVDLIKRSVDRGLGVIVGAHVGESSILTRAGLAAASAAGTHLIAQEGAFGTILLAQDVCDDPIMFGRGGKLAIGDHESLGRDGLGVVVIEDRLAGMTSIPVNDENVGC